MPVEKTHPLPVGTLLDGKFRVTREIGRGGMAAVYEAENVDIGKRVAVKVLAAELVSSRTVTERFLREARAAAAIRSPYICDVYDVGTFEDRPFLVMELLEGESLYDKLSRVRRLDIKPTITIATQVAKGLVKAHEANIVHRDLKPENIFLTKNEDGEVVSKIVDFGLAKFYEPALDGSSARLTKEGALFGTPAYMSPEQAKAQGEVDQRADLWALACIVYECLTGRTVWNVDQGVAMILAQIAGAPIPRPSRIREDLPKTFDEWFLRALDRNADKRYQTAREFADALVVALDPPEGSIKQSPINTAEEGEVVDRLVLTEPEPPPATRREPMLSPRRGMPGTVEPVASDETAALVPSLPPERSRGPGVAIGVLLVTSMLAFAGYGAWFYVLHPAERARVGRPLNYSPREAPSVDRHRNDLAETEPFALQIATAQEHLARGQADVAVQLFKGAFEASGQSSAARSLYNQADVIRENSPNAPCRVTGLGRPRPFAGTYDASSLPTVAVSTTGVVVGWAEADPATRRRFAYTTTLDNVFRRVTAVVAVTPEAKLVQQPLLAAMDDGLSLLYWDNAPEGSRVFVRKLDASGSIAGPPLAVSQSQERQSFPAMTREPSGHTWVAWTEKDGQRVSDLFARSLGGDLKPLTPAAARLTRYAQPQRSSVTASHAALAIAHGFLNVAYALERGAEHSVYALRVPLNDAQLTRGGMPAPAATGKDTDKQPDRFLGQLVPISVGQGQHGDPSIACIEAGCFVAWDDQKIGAHVAFFSGTNGEVIWRRDLGPKSLNPALAIAASDLVIAWYDQSRLRLARLSRDGVGEPTLIGHASGYQPPPNITAGAKPKEWIIAWRDFEAGQHEGFVARAECK
ncbi:MAG TPA: serine/threonine-protein kinase [Polyangiaceae bacterium]|nr:serine/threonine-protein kinase [Polyangiaceae bacterium]